MNKTVLITGASCGIGFEFAKIFARSGDNLILVARSEKKLAEICRELSSEYNISACYYAKDLSLPDAAKDIFEKVTADGHKVDYLVNNAGFGDNHEFIKTDCDVHRNMIKLNILALTELCHLFGKEMCEQKNGKILNVASVAAFSSGPYMSVYYASKAFVLSFSEALAEEFADYNVSITCLCPGPTESNFGKFSDFDKSNAFKYISVAKAKDVAENGYKAMMKGKTLCYHGIAVKGMAFLTRLSPRFINRKFAKYMNKSK